MSSFAESSYPECIEWCYLGDKGRMESYKTGQAALIETMYRANTPEDLVIDENTYTFDFDHMWQINVRTGNKRLIERSTPASSTSSSAASTEASSLLSTSFSSPSAAAVPSSLIPGLPPLMRSLSVEPLDEALLIPVAETDSNAVGECCYTPQQYQHGQDIIAEPIQTQLPIVPFTDVVDQVSIGTTPQVYNYTLPDQVVGDVMLHLPPPVPFLEIDHHFNFLFLPAFNDSEVVSRIAAIVHDCNVEISVLTSLHGRVSLDTFVREIDEVFRNCASRNELPLVKHFFRHFSVVRPGFEWVVYDGRGIPIPLPAEANSRLSLQYSLDGKAIINHGGKCTIDLSSLTVTAESSGLCGYMQPTKPVWSYSKDSAEFGFAPIAAPADWKTIDDVMLFGSPSAIMIGGSRCAIDFNTDDIPLKLIDLNSVQECWLKRDPPVASSVDREFVLHLKGTSGATKAALSAMKQMLESRVSSQYIDISSISPVVRCLLYQLARQYCVKVSKSTLETIQIQGTGQVYLDKVHLQLDKALVEAQKQMLQHAPTRGRLPANWDPQGGGRLLVPVVDGSREWVEVQALIHKTLPHARLVQLERVQNAELWERFDYARTRMEVNKKELNEKYLFHGTRGRDPAVIINDEKGFDFRYAQEGSLWGTGVYFAVNASYSDRYAYRKPVGILKQLLLAQVLTGKSIHYSVSDRTLKKPPDGFDTVNGTSNNSRVYIVYDHEKAYPAYLITYNG